MRAFKCDRCKKYFDWYDDMGMGTNKIFRVAKGVNPSTAEYLDLCPKCNDELQNWVRNEDKEENRKEN